MAPGGERREEVTVVSTALTAWLAYGTIHTTHARTRELSSYIYIYTYRTRMFHERKVNLILGFWEGKIAMYPLRKNEIYQPLKIESHNLERERKKKVEKHFSLFYHNQHHHHHLFLNFLWERRASRKTRWKWRLEIRIQGYFKFANARRIVPGERWITLSLKFFFHCHVIGPRKDYRVISIWEYWRRVF